MYIYLKINDINFKIEQKKDGLNRPFV